MAAGLVAAIAAVAAEPDTSLEEIVVTALRRTQTAEEVGVAIDTASGAEIQTLRIQQPLDLSDISPSLSTMNATTDSTPLFLISRDRTR